MRLDEPSWWYAGADQPQPLLLPLLRPVGRLASWLAVQRWHHTTGYRASLPVICVGNFTAGGTGKTPAAIELARQLIARTEHPVFLTRGYGGRTKTPTLVGPERSSAAQTGDEALLLARAAPTVVAPDRAAGARFIEAENKGGRLAATVIIMDDGLQNPTLAKDLVIAVVDGARGIGNGHVIPAGPLRAALGFQMTLTDAVLVNQMPGSSQPSNTVQWLKQRFNGPVLEATPIPLGDVTCFANRAIVAYAGIGNPARFFGLLRSHGAHIVDSFTFPDHHMISDNEARRVLNSAKQHSAKIVTTEKDWVRSMQATGDALALHAASHAIAIRLQVSSADEKRIGALLDGAFHAHKLKTPQIPA